MQLTVHGGSTAWTKRIRRRPRQAKAGCPISKALTGVEITLDVALECLSRLGSARSAVPFRDGRPRWHRGVPGRFDADGAPGVDDRRQAERRLPARDAGPGRGRGRAARARHRGERALPALPRARARCTVVAEVLRAGRSASQVRVRMLPGRHGRASRRWSRPAGSTPDSRAVLGRRRAGPQRGTASGAGSIRLPSDEPGRLHRRDHGPGRPAARARLARLRPRATRPGAASCAAGWRCRTTSRSTRSSLLFAVDAFPPATFDVELTGWVPTLELTAYVRALPAPGPVRVLQRAQPHRRPAGGRGLLGLGQHRAGSWRTAPSWPASGSAERRRGETAFGIRVAAGEQNGECGRVTAPARAGSRLIAAGRAWWSRSLGGRGYRRIRELDLDTHALALCAQQVLCTAPLIVAMSAVLQRITGHGVGYLMTRFFGLHGDSADAVTQLFGRTRALDQHVHPRPRDDHRDRLHHQRRRRPAARASS